MKRLFILFFSMSCSIMHTAQVNVEMKEHVEVQLSQEEQEAVDRMFAIINNKNKDNCATQIKQLQNLLQQYPQIINQKNRQGNTALIVSSAQNLKEIAQILIAANANIDQRLIPTLVWAATRGHKDIIQLLIKEGADKNKPCHLFNGQTAFDRARLYGFGGLGDVYKAAVEAGEEERREFLHKELSQYLLGDLANIIIEYAT